MKNFNRIQLLKYVEMKEQVNHPTAQAIRLKSNMKSFSTEKRLASRSCWWSLLMAKSYHQKLPSEAYKARETLLFQTQFVLHSTKKDGWMKLVSSQFCVVHLLFCLLVFERRMPY